MICYIEVHFKAGFTYFESDLLYFAEEKKNIACCSHICSNILIDKSYFF